MRIVVIIVCILTALASCKKDYKAPVPDSNNWDAFSAAAPLKLSAQSRSSMEGVYHLTAAGGVFGDTVAVKWSYVITGTDTVYHLSVFCEKDIAYFICEGKKTNGDILLNGYWRKMLGVETGIVRFTIKAAEGADLVAGNNPVILPGSIVVSGIYGNGQELPALPISFSYNRKLYSKGPFQIIAHRSGGRTSDLLPVSENSVAMIRKTPEFGSTGIEIDVRLTSDGIPILYHDNTLNLREAQKSGLIGPIKNYTFDQLSTFVRLIHGEKIPTLREALDAVVYQTALRFVWLDTKYTGSLQVVRDIQKEYLQKAAAAGRTLTIVIGLPTEDAQNDFLALPDYASAPNLCELSLEDVDKTNAEIWAPRFTLGTQNEQVAQVHAAGRQAFVWTLDVPDLIKQYLQDGHFDAILSNYPSSVAYYYYVQQ
ncbi:MAG: glycerophosphodiester phosphodiesterase [Chitinophagaceae bacterium]